jgi:hypothetical protein
MLSKKQNSPYVRVNYQQKLAFFYHTNSPYIYLTLLSSVVHFSYNLNFHFQSHYTSSSHTKSTYDNLVTARLWHKSYDMLQTTNSSHSPVLHTVYFHSLYLPTQYFCLLETLMTKCSNMLSCVCNDGLYEIGVMLILL